jgi:hypothetical protein
VRDSCNVATNLTVEGFPSAVSHFSIVSFLPPNHENRLVRPPFEGLSAVNNTKRASEKNVFRSGTSHDDCSTMLLYSCPASTFFLSGLARMG